ncbi:unnamed protein product [Bemisia tabaci]|uniref:DUF4806 domain-containing protein n=1 Tax=Bemisia tabaci TaxID=7038 RepID=A0A9P0F0Q4_BEMTA|nr:PREDICTED: protein PFC0760c-like [Bemisia tabaci]CAH0386986.1 unnamed protein product [Bemisia tabaci]
MKTYLVGIFPFDDTVDIIRESWLCGYNDELEQLCQFPAVHGDKKKLEDLLNTCEFPDDAWPKYVIVPKRTGIESYQEAVRIQKIIQEDENGATTDQDKLGRGFRNRKRNTFLESSDEDVPKCKKSKSNKSEARKKQKEAQNSARSQCASALSNFTLPNCKSFRIPSPSQMVQSNTNVQKNGIHSQKGEGFAHSTQKGRKENHHTLREISNVSQILKNTKENHHAKRPVSNANAQKKEIQSQKGKGFAHSTQKGHKENHPAVREISNVSQILKSTKENHHAERPVTNANAQKNGIQSQKGERFAHSTQKDHTENHPALREINNISQIRNAKVQPKDQVKHNFSHRNRIQVNCNTTQNNRNQVNCNLAQKHQNQVNRIIAQNNQNQANHNTAQNNQNQVNRVTAQNNQNQVHRNTGLNQVNRNISLNNRNQGTRNISQNKQIQANRNTSQNNQNSADHDDVSTRLRHVEGKLELILEKLSLTNELAQRSNKKMTGIKLAVDGSTEILKEVQAKMAEMAVSKICTATDEIEKRFPMNSIQELELMDHDLSDPEFRKKFVLHFSRKNAESVGDSVRNIVKILMTDGLASKFSWTGHKAGKEALNQYTMFITAFQDAVRVGHNVLDKEIDGPFKRWLVKAKERLDARGESEDIVDNQDEVEGECEFERRENESRDVFETSDNENEDGGEENPETSDNENQDGGEENPDDFLNDCCNENGNESQDDFLTYRRNEHGNQEDFLNHRRIEDEHHSQDDFFNYPCHDGRLSEKSDKEDDDSDDETYFSG